MAKRVKKFSGEVETCAHRVSFEYWGFRSKLTDELETELTDEAENRAHDMIADDGTISGELCFLNMRNDEEIRGWWEIVHD